MNNVTDFGKVFEQIFERECLKDNNAQYNRQKYWNFYYGLWRKAGYIRALESKMDEYEKKSRSERRYILEESGDGYLERVKNPYYNPNNISNEQKNFFCYSCGHKVTKEFTYCSKCGTLLKK